MLDESDPLLREQGLCRADPKGQDYDALRKCIHVSILEFIHFPKDQRCYRKIILCDAETGEPYTDLIELHILELKKLPPEDQNETGIIRWMRFLNGKSRKEFDHMAEKDEYIREACGELKKLSLDEQKRIEYEQREKAIRDYNSQMHSAERRGIEIGEERAFREVVVKMLAKGLRTEEISDFVELDPEEIKKIEIEWKASQMDMLSQ